MSLFKFDQFVFDSTNHRLTKQGLAVPLRPKASQLLALLLENSDRIVSKSEIFLSIWHSEYARDHLLFQLISELRKAPFNSEFVRTIPNKGYQWNVKTKVIENKSWLNIAASLFIATMCLTSLLLVSSGDKTALKLTQLPAHSAFSKGVIAMHTGNPKDAEQWFRFALNENPESIESSLFLAETLFHQNKMQESLSTLHRLLNTPNLAEYNMMTATDLLSRIHQRQGKFKDALRYAQQSNQTNVIAQCSVDAVENRIEFLERIIESPSDIDEQELLSTFDPFNKTEHHSSAPENEVDSKFRSNCQQLLNNVDDTSYCAPEDSQDVYVKVQSFKGVELS